MNGDFSDLIKLLPVLLPVAVVELGLMVFALVNIITRKRVKGGNKVPWVILVVLVSVIGPIIYFAFGREEEIIDGDKD